MLETVISPELVPAAAEVASRPSLQSSEAEIGPFELHDFLLYYVLGFGYLPSKIAFFAYHAWHEGSNGSWPDLVPVELRNSLRRVAETSASLELLKASSM